MAKYRVEDIRNIALVGHGAAGKTSLADALLFKGGAVDRRGSVDDGSSVSDFDGGALEALQAAENALIVISAPNGIEVNTRRMFSEAGRRGLARMLVINKMDADNIKFDELLGVIQDTFGKGCVLFNAPNGVGASFNGVVSVLNPPEAAPAGCPVDLGAARSKLVDAVVECDDALMEKYLMEGTVSAEELSAVIPKALAAGTVVPIFCTSAKKDLGVAELLESLTGYALSPAHGKKRVGVKGQG